MNRCPTLVGTSEPAKESSLSLTLTEYRDFGSFALTALRVTFATRSAGAPIGPSFSYIVLMLAYALA